MNTYYSLKAGECLLHYSWANAPVFRSCSTPPWNGRGVDMSSLLNEELGRVACFATENVRRHHLAYLQGHSLNMLASFFCGCPCFWPASWEILAWGSHCSCTHATDENHQTRLEHLQPGAHSCHSQLHWPGKKRANGCCRKPLRHAGRVTVEKITAMNLTGVAKNSSTKKYIQKRYKQLQIDIHVGHACF